MICAAILGGNVNPAPRSIPCCLNSKVPQTKKNFKSLLGTWNPKQPFMNGCFNWMIPNLYIENGCFTKNPFIWLFRVPGRGNPLLSDPFKVDE